MTRLDQTRDREQLEQAIAALEAQRAILGDVIVDASVAALRAELDHLEPAPPVAPRQRKQITVLFADVPGFTAMSEKVDAEEVSEIMNALWSRLDQDIVHHGGTIDKHMGDGVMAIWGAETAREDDPERAIRAALTMQASLASLSTERQLDLTMRIGINTGQALLGTMGTTGEYTAMGDTVNTASRLEQATPAGSVLISHDTYRHVRGVFDVRRLSPIDMRGKAEPIQVYIVERAKARAFRVKQRGVEGVVTRLIGRDVELGYLQDRLRATIQDRERQVITIVGDAGVGKSRLLDEFDHWIEVMPELVRFFAGRASLTSERQPYALLRDVFSFRFQIQDSDPGAVVRHKVEAGLGELLGLDDAGQMRAHLIGQLLGFDFSASPHVQGVLEDAQQLRDRALSYLVEYFEDSTRLAPTTIFLEDIHWADDTSLDAVEHLARNLAGHPLFIVCLARPALFERRPHWGEGQAFHTRLDLHPLSKSDSRRLVEEILQKVEITPAALCELVVSKAEGNPFYVEELTKMLIEDGVIVKGADEQSPWHVEPVRLSTVRVPPTLTGVLQARLDSLSVAERMVLQQASVVGRTFWDSVVVYINQHDQSDRPASAIEEALATLVAKEMLFWQDSSAFAGAQEYLFKHAILREVTYESVLRSVRRRYHALVADWLIEHSGERAVEMFGLIAEHLELAERTEQAIVYLRWAGQQAAGQFANAEAIHYFSRALTLLPDTDTTRDTRYALLSARERVYDLQGMRPAQARDLAELETLVNALPADDQCIRWQAELALRQANYAQVVGDFSAAIRAAQATIVHAQAAQDTAFEAAGYLQWGLALWRLGDLESCRARLEKALALAQSIGSRDLEAESLRILGNVYYYQGDYGEAAAYWKRSLPISRDIGDRAGEASALSNLGEAARSQGDYPGALTYYERRLRMCREIGDRWGETIAVLNLGLVSHNLGDDEASLAYSELVFQLASEIISPIHQAYALTTQGHALAGLGRLDEAAVAYQRAAAMRRESGEHHLVMEAVAGKARVCLAQGDLAGAQAQVDKILGYLDQEGGTLDGTEEPLRVYLTCYRVLQAQQDPRARAILQTAHRLLQERASRITDEALRRSFLENVPAHREIGREFTAGE